MSEISGSTKGMAERVPGRLADTILTPLGVSLCALLACAVLLSLRVTVPIGAMYWDLYVVVDGATRVLDGQVPSVDFFAPVGPLGYWLQALGMRLFPAGQPLLLTQWSYLLVTLPPILPVLARIDRSSRGLALALLLPLLLFVLFPINVEQASSFPSVDGYGIYNRQGAQVLYPLAVALVFERRQRVLLFAIAWCCLALFLSKITGFITGGLLCAFAFAAGRVRLATALGALGAFALGLGLIEAADGLVSAYVADISTLVTMNEGVLASRFIQAASIHFGIFGSGLCLVAALLWLDRRSARELALSALRRPSLATLHALLDRNAVWLAVMLFAGLFYETQNTGGQAFIFIWPVLLAILTAAGRYADRGTVLVFALVAATAVPPAVNVAHKGMRALIGQARYEVLPVSNLKGLGQVSQRPEVIERGYDLLRSYIDHRDSYQAFADADLLPTFTLYSELDFQVAWLLAASEAVDAVRAYETANGVRFRTVMDLNFVNPFAYLLDKEAVPQIAIGADPFRAVPPLDAAARAAVEAADLVLYPRCPVTNANMSLRRLYEPALSRHRLVDLSPCWQAYVRADLAPSS
ncbi:hypothetical protein [Aureimonas sp. AU4]|uniref:hypothetical protein n=1 Tax=Aureimonas sp. AU4 TaxID=1638163 RepID=UPI000785EE80|nr:hypothetical protein [Aureimonas sp. AU4]